MTTKVTKSRIKRLVFFCLKDWIISDINTAKTASNSRVNTSPTEKRLEWLTIRVIDSKY